MIFLPYISSYVPVFSSGGHFANWGAGETNNNNKIIIIIIKLQMFWMMHAFVTA